MAPPMRPARSSRATRCRARARTGWTRSATWTTTTGTASSLRQAILRGEILPGEWLRQEDLAARFGISPTPVREAMRQLQSEGLVEHIPRRGVKVVAYTLNSAREYYDLRELLEPYTLRLAAE